MDKYMTRTFLDIFIYSQSQTDTPFELGMDK